MLNDVIMWSKGTPTGKVISKEFPNHRVLIEMVSGLDVNIPPKRISVPARR